MPTWDVDPTQASNVGANRVQTGKELSGLLLANDIVRYRNGCHHDGDGSTGFLASYIELDNITLTTYGTGAKADLDSRIWLAPGSGGWTLVRTSGIVKAYRKLVVSTATAAVRRVWVGATNGGIGIGQRIEGTSMGRPPPTNGGTAYDIEDTYTLADEAIVLDKLFAAYNAQGRIWCSLTGAAASDRVLYMLVPSLNANDTPDNWYAGLAVLQTGTGSTIGAASPQGLRFRNFTTALVDGLSISGAGAALQLSANTTKASSGLTVQNCELVRWWSRGLQVQSTGSFGNSNIVFQDNLLDARPTADEQEPLSGRGWFHGAESIEATSNNSSAPITNIIIRRNEMSGLQHNALDVSTAANSTGVVSGVTVAFNTVTANDFETDVRGLSLHGISGAASGNLVYGNVVKNCCTESEFSGQVRVTGNFWLGMRQSASEPTLSTCVRLGPNGDRAQATTALEFSFNQLLGCPEKPIRILAGHENLPAGAITINRNILQMVGSVTDVAWDIKNNFTAYTMATDAVRIINNHIERATEPTIYWRTTTTGAQTSNTVSAGPSGTGADSITYTGNTYGTRLTPIPSSVYPPPAAVPMFG